MPRFTLEIVTLVGFAACGRLGFDPLGDGGGATDTLIDDGLNANANRIFVTSATFLGNLGGWSGADAICQGIAGGAGLSGEFVALLFDGTASLRPGLLSGSRGWIDLLGRPIARDPADFETGATGYPLQVDEHGMPLPPGELLFTGRNGGDCSDFTSSGNVGLIVTTTDRGMFSQTPFNGNCSVANHLICAERGRNVDLVTPIESGRIAFLTTNGFAADGGLAGADALCNAEAAAAQLPGTYRAWLGTSAGGPDTRFVPAGLPWRRVDGPRLAPTAADFLSPTSYLTTFLNRTATGAAIPYNTWAGSTTANCLDWTTTVSAASAPSSNPITTQASERREFFGYLCPFALGLVCLQL